MIAQEDSSIVISDSDEKDEDGEDEEEEEDREEARRYMDGLLTLAARAVIEKKLRENEMEADNRHEALRMYKKMMKRQSEKESRERMLKHQIVNYLEAIHEARAEQEDAEDSDEESSSYDENNVKGKPKHCFFFLYIK